MRFLHFHAKSRWGDNEIMTLSLARVSLQYFDGALYLGFSQNIGIKSIVETPRVHLRSPDIPSVPRGLPIFRDSHMEFLPKTSKP